MIAEHVVLSVEGCAEPGRNSLLTRVEMTGAPDFSLQNRVHKAFLHNPDPYHGSVKAQEQFTGISHAYLRGDGLGDKTPAFLNKGPEFRFRLAIFSKPGKIIQELASAEVSVQSASIFLDLGSCLRTDDCGCNIRLIQDPTDRALDWGHAAAHTR